MYNESEKICLDKEYSTTQLLSKEKPEIFKEVGEKFSSRLCVSPSGDKREMGGLRTKGYFKKDFSGNPLVTMVTVVYNGEKYLEKTIKSVINQSYDNIEYIIIDGGSDDRTVEIIKNYEDTIDYWVSEKDRGIYDAMNKGISLSLGNTVGIINSDDQLLPNTVEEVAKASVKTSKKEFVIHGKIAIYKSDDTFVKVHRPKKIPGYFLFSTPFKHPAMFVSRKLYKKVGLFHLDCGLAADYDLMLRILSHDSEVVYLDQVLTKVYLVGVSTGGRQVASWQNLYQILKKNTRSNLKALIGISGRMMHKALGKIISSIT